MDSLKEHLTCTYTYPTQKFMHHTLLPRAYSLIFSGADDIRLCLQMGSFLMLTVDRSFDSRMTWLLMSQMGVYTYS